MELHEILTELSGWIEKRSDKRLKINIDSRNERTPEITLEFFEFSADIPGIYSLGEKYVILVKNTGFHYKGLYQVNGIVDSEDNYLAFQRRI